MAKQKLIDKIEKPIRDLIKILRENGFNTFCSCGHLPHPYIQMEWYEDIEVTKLYGLLIENKYKNFLIRATWDSSLNKRVLEISFCYITQPVVNLDSIKEKQ